MEEKMFDLTYKNKIRVCFKHCCSISTDTCASPADVFMELEKRNWLAKLDTVIDIADIMKSMRQKGLL